VASVREYESKELRFAALLASDETIRLFYGYKPTRLSRLGCTEEIESMGADIKDGWVKHRPISRHHKALAPDWLGYGQSDKPKVTYSTEYQLEAYCGTIVRPLTKRAITQRTTAVIPRVWPNRSSLCSPK
jgi:hypothetical protein